MHRETKATAIPASVKKDSLRAEMEKWDAD